MSTIPKYYFTIIDTYHTISTSDPSAIQSQMVITFYQERYPNSSMFTIIDAPYTIFEFYLELY